MLRLLVVITLLNYVLCDSLFTIYHEIERNALISLYKSTNGDNWINNTNWLSDKPLDMWHGITLNELDFVCVLELPFNNLIGSLNDEFGYLIHLTFINFGFNYLTGLIPLSFANLTNLEYIAFDANNFEGPMSFLNNFQILQIIHIPDNHFTGPFDLNSIYLLEVYCSNNYLTGSLLSSSLITSKLNYFNTGSNYFTGLTPNFSNYSDVHSINIEFNYLTGSLSKFPENLVQLFASNNGITGKLPQLPESLTYFEAYDNEISGTLPELPLGIIYFFIDSNQLTGSVSVTWSKYIYLANFDVGSNSLTGTITDLILSNLISFEISSNFFTGHIPLFTDMSRYVYANLAVNYFTGTLHNDFDSSCQLTDFFFQFNYLEGTIPSSHGNCVSMEHYYLSSNLLTGSIPIEFINMHFMIKLLLSLNYMSGTISNSTISNMKLLYDFEISSNKFEGVIPSAFSSNRFLFIFSVGDNHLTGSMPTLKSKFISEIEISNNFLTGTIPIFYHSIQYLFAENNYFYGKIYINEMFMFLSTYDVGNNYLTGSIPSEISMITLLNAFYVHSNHLTSTFPSELCNLSNLKAAYSVSSYDFLRCQNEQDLALCSILQQTDFYDKLSLSVEYVTQVYESSHPYNEIDNSSYFNLVNVSGASKYILTFDIWTDFDIQNHLQICADSYCLSVIKSYQINEIPGINGNDPLELLYPYFYINIQQYYIDNYFQYWGYLVTVKAYLPLIGWNCTSPTQISQSYDNEMLSKYNLTLSSSYARHVCGDSNWRGIDCTFVSVTSLSLESYGISGTIPSSLGLLSALEFLYLSYNSFSGPIPKNIGNLTNLQILDLSNNKLSDEIPSELGQITELQYLYLQSNNLIGIIPESLAFLNKSLQLMSLSANQLTGKLSNDLCSLTNASIDVSGNNLICYEECWDHVNGKSLKSGDLSVCAPTSYPTSQPSSPTFKPTSFHEQNKSNVFMQFIYVLAAVLLFIMVYLIYRNLNSKEKKLSSIRKKALYKLPIHRFIFDKKPSNEILQMIRYASSTISSEDYDGNNVIDLALKHQLNNEIITEILIQLLSMQLDEDKLSNHFVYAWTRVVQSDFYINSVRHILDVYYSLSRELSDCLDENGRSAVNIASPLCRQVIRESLYFLRRYDFGNNIYPSHVSETSVIYMAIDTQNSDENKRRVAIKFISNKDSFKNEIRCRIELSTESDSIIPILDSYNASNHSHYDFEIRRRKLDKYMYCIVMPAGEKNLGNIIGTERIAGKDWTQLKLITTQLAVSINHLHSKQYIHGDIKPLNVIRLGNEIKLIDLDACAKVGTDYYGTKYSPAYVPPEILHKDENVQFMNGLSIKTLLADYSQDSWSFGMLLYELYTGMSFYLKDYDDDIDVESFELLYEFNDDMKLKKLSKISDRFARNLVSLLLDKDPNKRLTMSRVLEHPFLTGRSAVRLEGEKAEFDIFISYRVDSDLHHAQKVYDLLSSQGYKVWFDRMSLLPGLSWETGISDGLVKSRVLMPIISRDSLNDSTNLRSNITLLKEDSPCDNVLFEYELALELKERGLLTKIYPILIGDFNDHSHEYVDYFASGCYPKDLKNIVVNSIDYNVRNHLHRLGLGSRLLQYSGIKSVVETIFKSQGFVVKGSIDNELISILKDIQSMTESNIIYTS